MNSTSVIKGILLALVGIFGIGSVLIWVKTFIVNQYYVNGSFFQNGLMLLVPIVVIFISYHAVKAILNAE